MHRLQHQQVGVAEVQPGGADRQGRGGPDGTYQEISCQGGVNTGSQDKIVKGCPVTGGQHLYIPCPAEGAGHTLRIQSVPHMPVCQDQHHRLRTHSDPGPARAWHC